MTLRNRILSFNLGTFSLVLLFVGVLSYQEFKEQQVSIRDNPRKTAEESPAREALEVVLYGGATALVLALVFSRLFLNRTLDPITEFTDVLERTNIENLSEPVQRSGNGDELDRMAVVYNRLKQRLDLSFTQTREFTMHASHELKTPLTIMHATLEQMLSDGGFSSPQQRKLESMLEEVQRLSVLSGQLVFLAKADAQQMSFAKNLLALDELVRELGEDCVELGRHRGIRVELLRCDPVSMMGDKMRIRQLLLNLADNAVKYNEADGLIQISLIDETDAVKFVIANRGKAIPNELRQRIFERFFRCDASHQSTIDGAGLGLSISQIIVSLHSGQIAYDLDETGLNRFTLSFPKASSTAAETH